MVLAISYKSGFQTSISSSIEAFANKLSLPFKSIEINELQEIAISCMENEANFLFIHLANKKSGLLLKVFENCRELRIPYLLCFNDINQLKFEHLLMPVHFLVEEKGKAQYASALARFCKTSITLLKANDYGSRAQSHSLQIIEMLAKLNVNCDVVNAQMDSFKVDREAVRMTENKYDCLLLSASRDYGLDDLVFGPPEVRNTKISPVPIIWVNPRGDLYALCD